MLNLVRKYIIPAVQNRWFRLFVLIFIFVQVISQIARWSDKAYQEDIKWERPPDRLPDLVDATIAAHNQDAKIQQAMREYDRALKVTPTIQAPVQDLQQENIPDQNS